MNGSRTRIVAILIVVSVVLSAAVGVTGNALVGSPGWALMSALLVLVACLAAIEVVRHRLVSTETAAEPPSTESSGGASEARASGGITISGSRLRGSVVAGRDVNQTRIGTGGLAAVILLVVLLGGFSIWLGRTDAAIPERAVAKEDLSGAPDGPSVPSAAPATPGRTPDVTPSTAQGAGPPVGSRGDGPVGTSGRDLDPKEGGNGLDDVSFRSRNNDGGLTLLNQAAIAAIPNGRVPTPEVCSGAGGYSGKTVKMPIAAGTTWCVRTSDTRYGTLSVTYAESNALGGAATITWTVWEK